MRMRIHKNLERKVKHIFSLHFQKVKTIREEETEAMSCQGLETTQTLPTLTEKD